MESVIPYSLPRKGEGVSLSHELEAFVTVGFRFTSADLETFPDIPGARYEIIDGELHVSRQPQFGHQYSGDEVYRTLANWSEESRAGFACTVPGLVFAEDNDVIPDVVWVSHARLAETLDESGHFRAAPELVVEVLLPGRANEVRDRELKLGLYSRQGVHEYWIVDWQAHTVDVYRRGPTGLEQVGALGNEDALSSPLLPGFSCRVASLWAPTIP